MRYILLVCLTLFKACAFPHSNKTFDCGLFSFDYSSSFKNCPIQNAPHMVLKLESKEYFFSASYWDKGYDSSISIWNEEIIESYKKMPTDEDIVAIDKVTIRTKGGNEKCLRLKSNLQKQAQGVGVNLKMTKYIMIKGRFLFVFGFVSNGKSTQSSSTTYTDDFMKGLKFKSQLQANSSTPSKEDFQSELIKSIKNLNAQCPIQADDCTVYKQFVLSGNMIIINTIIEDACDNIVDYDEFKRIMTGNFSVALGPVFIQLMDAYGYTLAYHIYNERNKLKKIIQIKGEDILNQYKKGSQSKSANAYSL